MSNVTINGLTAANTIDAVQDLIPIYQNSTTSTLAISRNNYLNLTSAPVGLNDIQTLTNKTLTSPTINGGTLSGTFSGTYTLSGTPTFPSTVVLTTANQTLTNKTLTSPTINTPTITTPTITNGTASGLSLSSSTVSSSTINTSTLTGGTTVTGGMTLTGGLTADSITVSGQSITNGWNALNQTLTYSANNGNKEFVLTSTANLTSTLNAGMKLQLTRGTTPPTQCMNFTSASLQYAFISSPSGITFTNTFTIEAWVYLTSYTTQVLIGRLDSTGTNGWQMYIASNGKLVVYYNGGSGATEFRTFQAIPLNQWVHLAGVVTSVASKSALFYINGVNVPAQTTSGGSTTLSQTGSLAIAANGIGGTPGNFVNGYMSEVRVWSSAQSQAQIQANMGINLVGTETGLVGLWRGNGNFNDLTSNANNLTATNGAIATQLANPYNLIEYGIVTSVIYSGGATTMKVFTGNSNTIPNQTLTLPYYSVSKTPFGFSAAKSNWTLNSFIFSSIPLGSSLSTWYSGSTVGAGSWALSIPTGAWNVSYYTDLYTDSGYNQNSSHYVTLSTSTTTIVDYYWQTYAQQGTTVANSYFGSVHTRTGSLTTTSITPYYMLGYYTGSGSNANFNITPAIQNIAAECAYL